MISGVYLGFIEEILTDRLWDFRCPRQCLCCISTNPSNLTSHSCNHRVFLWGFSAQEENKTPVKTGTQSHFQFLPLSRVFKWLLAPQNRVARVSSCNLPLQVSCTSLVVMVLMSTDANRHFQYRSSSAVVIFLVLLWQSWWYHNSVCHLSDGDSIYAHNLFTTSSYQSRVQIYASYFRLELRI